MCLRGGACLRMGFFRAHFFLAAPSPLSLLLFKFGLVSIGVSSAGWLACFVFFLGLLDVGIVGDTGVAGDASVTHVAGVVGTTVVAGDAGVAGTADVPCFVVDF